MSLSRAAASTSRWRPLLLALVSGIGRQLAVGIEAGRVGAELHRQRGDGAVVMHHAVELCAFLFGFLHAVADHDEGAGQDHEMFGVAADLFHPALDVGVELLAVGKRCRRR